MRGQSFWLNGLAGTVKSTILGTFARHSKRGVLELAFSFHEMGETLATLASW